MFEKIAEYIKCRISITLVYMTMWKLNLLQNVSLKRQRMNQKTKRKEELCASAN